MRRAAIAIALVIAFLLAAVAFVYRGLPGYVLADTQYRRLVTQRPKSRAEVERVLLFDGAFGLITRHRRIAKAESDYGRHTQLSGDFTQYSILGAAIDVVYDRNGRVVTILPSYE